VLLVTHFAEPALRWLRKRHEKTFKGVHHVVGLFLRLDFATTDEIFTR